MIFLLTKSNVIRMTDLTYETVIWVKAFNTRQDAMDFIVTDSGYPIIDDCSCTPCLSWIFGDFTYTIDPQL